MIQNPMEKSLRLLVEGIRARIQEFITLRDAALYLDLGLFVGFVTLQ